MDEIFDIEQFHVNPTALEGLTVVITGKLTKIDRKQAEALVERAGGKATGSISSKTNLLVAGEKAGSKLQKAEKLGIEVLDEEGFISRIKQQTNNASSKNEINEASESSSFLNHPKDYADWENIEPFNNEELEMETGLRDDLDINNLTSIFYHSCQHFNYDRLHEGVIQYYFDSLGDEEREAEMKEYEDKDTGDIMVLESAIDTYLGALNKDEKQELYKRLIKPEDTSVNPEALKGLKVVITGTMVKLDRRQAEIHIERAGGKLASSISSKVKLLIKGEKGSIKMLQKAEELGIEILDEKGFLERIEYSSIYD